MNIKILHRFMFLLLLTLVPLKIFFSLNGNGFENSYLFIVICLIALSILFYLSIKIDTKNQRIFRTVKPNAILGIMGILTSLCFIWNGISFFKNEAGYDTGVNYFFLFICSFISAVSFIVVSISHFLGKNKFKFFQVLVFSPALYFIVSLTLFLSLSKTQNGYLMASQSLLTMFFVYYTRVYVKQSSKINTIKRLVLFSFSSFLVVLMSNFAVILLIHDFYNIEFISSLTCVVSSIYALLFTLILFKDNVDHELQTESK